MLKSSWGLLVFFILVSVVGWFGAQFPADQWYETLNRAPWNPPNWAFPLAWSILYCCIAVVGWLVYRTHYTLLKALWFLQLLINAAWSWLFFGLHRIDLGLIDLVVLDVLVVVFWFVALKLKLTKIALLWSPYLLWILLATSLNAYILIMN